MAGYQYQPARTGNDSPPAYLPTDEVDPVCNALCGPKSDDCHNIDFCDAERRRCDLILTPAWLIGYPEIGLFLVAVWTAVCLVVHGAQVVQAMIMGRARVVSWLSV